MRDALFGRGLLCMSWCLVLMTASLCSALGSALAQPSPATALLEKARLLVEENKSAHRFQPEAMNLLGQAARLQYEESVVGLSPAKLEAKAKGFFEVRPEGKIAEAELLSSYRFEMIAQLLHKAFKKTYPGLIVDKPKRVLNNVGGVYGLLEVYYCSAREYVAMFATLLPQQGYSGHYPFMDVYDIMVDGEMKSHGIDRPTGLVKSYGPEDISLLQRNERRYYNMGSGALMIDYGRGFILPAFWPGVIAPAVFINQDLPSLAGQLHDCAQGFLKSLGR